MNVLILAPLDPYTQSKRVLYSNTNNHFVFYSLEIAHELEKMGCVTSIERINDAFETPSKLETLVFDIILAIGYFNDLVKLCDVISQSEFFNNKTLFTMSTANVIHERILTHFVMKQQTFFNTSIQNDVSVVELPIPKTLSFREVKLATENPKICIDGPARSVELQHLSPNMDTIYSSILEYVNPNDVCQLSPWVGFYDQTRLPNFQPPKSIREIPYLTIPKLELFLSSIDHFIITVCESYGAIVADCLSTNTLVHYPIEPLVPNKSLPLVADIPNCIPFSSASELCTNLKEQKFSYKYGTSPNPIVFKYVAEYLAKDRIKLL